MHNLFEAKGRMATTQGLQGNLQAYNTTPDPLAAGG